jgi:hypothetical protein
VLAVLGIARSTESGIIDPLNWIGSVTSAMNVHYHVDAAFGGSFLMDETMRKKLIRIELADSVSICAHKQMYLPIGLSIYSFKNPSFVRSSSHYKLCARTTRFIIKFCLKFQDQALQHFKQPVYFGSWCYALAIFSQYHIHQAITRTEFHALTNQILQNTKLKKRSFWKKRMFNKLIKLSALGESLQPKVQKRQLKISG